MIPYFRAKKIDSDEYVIGYLFQDCFGFYIIQTDNALRCETLNQESMEIDHQTLSISFSDMLDSQGNRIFASLSKDGKGGDICSVNDYIDSGLNGVAIYQNYGFRIDRKGKAMGISLSSTDIKIIGIQQ